MIYGRDELVENVARSRAAVLLITGDSGVGKSEILVHAQEKSGEAITPAPVTLDRSPGNLQRALIIALADALATIVEHRGVLDQVGRRVAQASLELARERSTDLAKALGAEVLALVRHKLGPEVGAGIASFINQLRAAGDADISARINAASDPSIAQTWVALAGEVSGLAEGQPLLLALDAAESMTAADRGVLGDLAQALSGTVRLRVAFSTYSAEQRTWVDELLASDPALQEQAVGGLDLRAVAVWLNDVELEDQVAERVHRLTGGYPLLVQSVIADVRAGGDVDNAPLHQHFAAQTELSWNALDPPARACARMLSVLPEPLPEGDCAELCSMSPSEYADVVERLRRGFILSTIVNGHHWFHEQRRALVRGRLTQEESAVACARAAERVLEHLRRSNDLGWVEPLSELVSTATPLLDADEKLTAATVLPTAELAVCAALIELGEKQHDFVVGGDELLRHARAWFGADGDLVAALREIAKRDLVGLLEQPFVSLARANWSLMTLVTLQGRAARQFGRLPIPSLTSMFFAMGLKPALGPFERFAYGVGRPSWTAIAHGLLEPRKPTADVRASSSLGELGPGLLARGRIGGRPLHCAARYESSRARDQALRALDGLSAELLGERLEVDEVLAHPGLPVASNRFLTAIERATGHSIERPSGHRRPEHLLGQPLEVQEQMELKAQTLSLIRTLCSARERVAADLSEPAAWHWLAHGDWVIEGAVRGAGEGAVRHRQMTEGETNDPYNVYRIIEAFDLPPNASLATFHQAAGEKWKRTDPVVDIVGQISRAMGDFNGTQHSRELRFDEDELRDALLAARQLALADARALSDALPMLGERRPLPPAEALYLMLERTDPTTGLFYGEHVQASYEAVPSESGREEVHMALMDYKDRASQGLSEGESPLEYFRRRSNELMQAGFDKDASGQVLTTGDGHTLIARLLGYDSRDVRLLHVDADGIERPM